MNFKPLTALLWIIAALFGRAEDPAEEFVAEFFGTVPPQQQLVLDAAAQTAVREVTGWSRAPFSVPYWEQDGRRIWRVQTFGKHGAIRTVFLIENGRILQSRIVSHREQRGRQIDSSQFLKQFKNRRLDADGKLSQSVHGYSGATRSTDAVQQAARMALHLDALIDKKLSAKK